MTEITQDQFEELFKEYLKDHPNQGSGYWAKYGWYLATKRKFKESLKATGIEVQSDKTQ